MWNTSRNILYIATVTDKIKEILSSEYITTRLQTVRTIRQLFPSIKDALPNLKAKEVHKLKATVERDISIKLSVAFKIE